jgi:hypothetical protein
MTRSAVQRSGGLVQFFGRSARRRSSRSLPQYAPVASVFRSPHRGSFIAGRLSLVLLLEHIGRPIIFHRISRRTTRIAGCTEGSCRRNMTLDRLLRKSAIFEMGRRPCERGRAPNQAKYKAQRYQLVTDIHVSSSRPASAAAADEQGHLSCLASRIVQCPEQETEPATA